MLNVKDLSKEIEMTAVRGGSQGITQIGSAQVANSGFGGIVVLDQTNGQYASQYNSTVDNTYVTNVLGLQNAGVWHFMG